MGERERVSREVAAQNALPSRGPFMLCVGGQPLELMLKLAQKADRAGELASLLQLAQSAFIDDNQALRIAVRAAQFAVIVREWLLILSHLSQ